MLRPQPFPYRFDSRYIRFHRIIEMAESALRRIQLQRRNLLRTHHLPQIIKPRSVRIDRIIHVLGKFLALQMIESIFRHISHLPYRPVQRLLYICYRFHRFLQSNAYVLHHNRIVSDLVLHLSHGTADLLAQSCQRTDRVVHLGYMALIFAVNFPDVSDSSGHRPKSLYRIIRTLHALLGGCPDTFHKIAHIAR